MKHILTLIIIFLYHNPSTQAFCVVIDPGHGGVPKNDDQEWMLGCKGPTSGMYEKDITLAIARFLQAELKKNGIKAILTRDGDIILDEDRVENLKKRTQKAHKNDIFVSIHVNSGKPSQKGLQVFIPFQEECPESSLLLAGKIHHQLVHEVINPTWQGNLGNLNTSDGGIRQARFNVLMSTQCPSVLIETGYITNPEEEKLLISASYQKKLAHAIARGIQRYGAIH